MTIHIAPHRRLHYAIAIHIMITLLMFSLLATAQIFSSVLAGDVPLNTTDASSIKWGPCGPSVITNPALTCSFFEVPLDYHDPAVGHARLALVKLNATGDRLGTLFFNPGMFAHVLSVPTSANRSAIQVVLVSQVWTLSTHSPTSSAAYLAGSTTSSAGIRAESDRLPRKSWPAVVASHACSLRSLAQSGRGLLL